MSRRPEGRRPPTRFSLRDLFRRRHLEEAPMGVTDDRNDPRLRRGVDEAPIGGQHDTYLVLSARDRAQGFVRPLRREYRHLMCGSTTSMGLAIAETYARQPAFYGATFCVHCDMHRPVGENGEFVWIEADGSDGPKVGT